MRRSVACSVFFRAILLAVCAIPPVISHAQQQPAAPAAAAAATTAATGKALTVDRIYSQPSLSGHLTRGVVWTPDSRQISFFENKSAGKEMKSELWSLEVVSGQRHLLLSTEKLDAVLPAETEE